MTQARASPQTRRLKALRLLGLPILAIAAVMVLASFLTQPSTVHAADTEGVVMDRSSSIDMAAAEAGFGLGAWTVDIAFDPSVVRVVDCTASCSSIGSGAIRVTGHADNDILSPDSAITIDDPSSTFSSQGVMPKTSAGQDLITFSIIGAVLVSIAFATMATISLHRRRDQLLSRATTTSTPTSEMVTTFMGRQDGERRQDTQASSVSASPASPTAAV